MHYFVVIQATYGADEVSNLTLSWSFFDLAKVED